MISNSDLFVIKMLMENVEDENITAKDAIDKLKEYIKTQKEEKTDLLNNV